MNLLLCVYASVEEECAPRGVGSMHQHGKGVPEDIEKAVEHYQTGAELGRERNALTFLYNSLLSPFSKDTLYFFLFLYLKVTRWHTCHWQAATPTDVELRNLTKEPSTIISWPATLV